MEPNVNTAKARRLRAARTCYGHLAGQLGVALADAMAQRGLIATTQSKRLMLTESGRQCLENLGLNPATFADGPEGHARHCMDWTECQHHLAGPMPALLFTRLLELGWLQPGAEPRAIIITPSGHLGLEKSFGILLRTDLAA